MERTGDKESVTPSRLLKIFEEAPQQYQTCRGSNADGNNLHPTFLPGETLERKQDNVTCVDTLSSPATGVLYITNYRMIFRGAFCHSTSDGDSANWDQDEIAKRGYRYQKKRYQLPKVNHGIKKIHSMIGQSMRKKGKLIKSSFRKQGGVFSNKYNVESGEGIIEEPEEREVDLLRMRLGTHLMLERVNVRDSDADGDVIADCIENVSISLPIISIRDIKKFPKQFLVKEKLKMLRDGIEATCNNLTSVKFCIGGSENGDVEELLSFLEDRLCRQVSPFSSMTSKTPPSLPLGLLSKKNASEFAYTYAASLRIPEFCRAMLQDETSPNFYNFEVEVERLKLTQSRHLERIEQNVCPRYPRHVIVPACIQSREELRSLGDFHRNSCFPIVTWRSSASGGFLLRSSIPHTARGLSDQRCEVDEKLLNQLRNVSSDRDAKVWVFTEKPKIPSSSSNNNQSGLKVSEGEVYYYPHCSFVNDDLPDVQTVQQNGFQLMNCLSDKTDDSKCLSQIEDSGWLGNVRRLLEISIAIASEIHNEKSTVLVAYDDGVDRTSQVVSLVQMMLDPYYRTLDGFQVLIQKEWLSIRHPFFARNLSAGIVEDDLSPIFLQFLDCVWQLTSQFPTMFQFNEQLLEALAIHSYSGRFGTFIDFKISGIVGENPVSFWTWLNVVSMARDDFSNSNYDENENTGPIFPITSAPWIQIWTWHYRYKTEETLVLAQHVAYMQLEKLQRDYRERLEEHQMLLKQLSEIDATSAEQYAFHTRNSGSILNRSASCMTNYSYHLGTNSDPKSKISLSSFFSKKAKSYDSLQSANGRDKVGKSTFYDETNQGKSEKMKLGTFPRSEMVRNPKNLRTILNENGVKFIGVSDVKVTEKTCSGYLVKQGKVRRSWKRRWFVLDSRKGCVAYFENHLSDHPKGVFKCTFITQVYPHLNQDKCPNLFYIDTVERRYAAEAPNINAMKVWLTCFNAIL